MYNDIYWNARVNTIHSDGITDTNEPFRKKLITTTTEDELGKKSTEARTRATIFSAKSLRLD